MNKKEKIILAVGSILSTSTALLAVDLGLISGWYQVALGSFIGLFFWLGYLAKIID